MNWDKVHHDATSWIKEAGARIRESLRHQIDISSKADENDLVTNVDRETEQFFVKNIRKNYPEHKILGEEGFGEKITSADGILWVIDPIDGTVNFVHQKRNFMISVGIFENGVGKLGYIYDVTRDELLSAKKGEGAWLNETPLSPLEKVPIEKAIIGINPTWVTENRRIDYRRLVPIVKQARGARSFGSAAMEMFYVACGWLDAYISLRLSPWDFAAGKIIVEELGGKATTLSGQPLSLLKNSSLIVAKPGLHEYILKNFLEGYEEK